MTRTDFCIRKRLAFHGVYAPLSAQSRLLSFFKLHFVTDISSGSSNFRREIIPSMFTIAGHTAVNNTHSFVLLHIHPGLIFSSYHAHRLPCTTIRRCICLYPSRSLTPPFPVPVSIPIFISVPSMTATISFISTLPLPFFTLPIFIRSRPPLPSSRTPSSKSLWITLLHPSPQLLCAF
jgi:hypothetical protein